MKRRFMPGLILLGAIAGCAGGAEGTDAGPDAVDATDGQDARDGEDAGPDDGGPADQDGDHDPPPGPGCPFDFRPPRVRELVDELGDPHQVRDRHLLCTLEHEGLEAQVFLLAEPTGFNFMDVLYQAWRGFVCQDGQVRELQAADLGYEARHHGWDVLQVVLGGRRYVYRWSEACFGYRPCTPSFDCFDVRDQAGSTLLASRVPATCVELGADGKPLPLVPMARVPASGLEAIFPMGSDSGSPDERPVHQVRVWPHRVDAREATWADLALFLGDHGPDCDGAPCLDLGGPGVGVELLEGRYRAREGREAEPAGFISWGVADAYCRWRGLHLPSEAAWELAASAGGTRTFPWGAEAPDCSRAVFADCQLGGPAEACSTPAGASAEGGCDLAGNLAEWVEDWYAADFYAQPCDPAPCRDPRGPEAPTGEKVFRGGAFDSPGDALRAAARGHAPPATASAQTGVRCALSTGVQDYPAPEP